MLESTKDGVYVRSLSSPLASDSLVVLRPRLSTDLIAEALARGLSHEGKPYDFDFDFTRSDRLVCTEVVYRSYEGMGPMRFRLKWRVGRPTLSGSDLTKMAIKGVHFDPVAVFAPRLSPALVIGEQSREMMRRCKSRFVGFSGGGGRR